MSENLAKQPGPGRATREALSDFPRKWYSHLVFFFSFFLLCFFIFLHLQVQFGVWMPRPP